MIDSGCGSWFAFRVKPRHEKAVAVQLRQRGYSEFLPLVREQRQWGSRPAKVDLPLFPGYIFCQTQRDQIYPVLNLPAVIDVIRAGSHPVPADKEEIEALKRAIDGKLHIEPWDYTEVGTAVTITNGPLVGLTGVVVEVRQTQRLVLSVSLLRRSVLVEVDRECIAQDARASQLLAFQSTAAAH